MEASLCSSLKTNIKATVGAGENPRGNRSYEQHPVWEKLHVLPGGGQHFTPASDPSDRSLNPSITAFHRNAPPYSLSENGTRATWLFPELRGPGGKAPQTKLARGAVHQRLD